MSDFKAGDMVMVWRYPMKHCDGGVAVPQSVRLSLGTVFTVGKIWPYATCPKCLELIHGPRAQPDDGRWVVVPFYCLKKLDPSAEQEKTREVEHHPV